jgi:putative transposase
MAGSFTALYYHCVFSTKNREPLVTPELQPRLYDYVGGLTHKRESRLLACGGVEDHIHLLVSMSKELSVPMFLRDIKSNSSLWVHQTFRHMLGFAWQEGYGAFTVSVSALDRVRAYIENQEEHHRGRDFKTEFLSLLTKHKVPYDERYIWR